MTNLRSCWCHLRSTLRAGRSFVHLVFPRMPHCIKLPKCSVVRNSRQSVKPVRSRVSHGVQWRTDPCRGPCRACNGLTPPSGCPFPKPTALACASHLQTRGHELGPDDAGVYPLRRKGREGSLTRNCCTFACDGVPSGQAPRSHVITMVRILFRR